MSSHLIIDVTTFEELKENMGLDFIDEILQAYFEETPKLIRNLQQALKTKDYEGFTRAAHSIKSTSNSVGALYYGTLARELEIIGKERNLENVSGKVEMLVSGYTEVQQALEELTHAK
jgi:histidine phosphotransfer protein HptB